MRLKLDENLGRRQADLFRAAGHEASTVFDENLTAAPDQDLARVCRDEGRCLVTLDLDFGNPLVFPPWDYQGVAVLRVARPASVTDLDRCVTTLLAALGSDDVRGKLWIVEAGRVRVYRPDRDP